MKLKRSFGRANCICGEAKKLSSTAKTARERERETQSRRRERVFGL